MKKVGMIGGMSYGVKFALYEKNESFYQSYLARRLTCGEITIIQCKFFEPIRTLIFRRKMG